MNLCCELVFILCYCDVVVGNLYSFGGFGQGRLGLECSKHCGPCTSHATLSGVTGTILGVASDHVA
jgi:hypothetical protein